MSECKTCYSFGMWGIGDPSPMGPMDAGTDGHGMPTIPCPECGANANPMEKPRVRGKSNKLLNSFTKYCKAHPEERFWQALRNWSGSDFILKADSNINIDGKSDALPWQRERDTFYEE